MKTLLACCGLDGDLTALDRLRVTVREKRPDAVLFAGGVLRPGREYDGWDLTLDDARFVEDLLHTLGGLGVFTAIIHGRADEPADELLRLAMNAELEYPALRIAHGTLCHDGELAVCGVGGRVCDGPAYELGLWSRTQAELSARSLRSATAPRKALLLATSAEEEVCAALIGRAGPGLCVAPGEDGRWGSRRVGGAVVVCPGHLAEGMAAWVKWDGEPEVSFLDLVSGQELREDSAHGGLADARERRAAGLVEKP